MMVLWLVGCLGTYTSTPSSPTTEAGPYRLTLPSGLEPVELGSTKRESMFVARFRRPEPLPDQQVIVSRPTRVSDLWPDGPLPDSATSLRSALMPIRYEETTWLGGKASIGAMDAPDGRKMIMWAAVRDGWLHELQCSANNEEDSDACLKVAASFEVVSPATPSPPVPSSTHPEKVGPLTVPMPEGWDPVDIDPATPDRLLQAAAPVPNTADGERSMGHLAVELIPSVDKLGHWVDALVKSYDQTGMLLLSQERFDGPHGDAFRCEYSDGMATTVSFDSLTPRGILHVECSDNVTRRSELDVLCRKVHEGIVFETP